ncbi:MAG: SPOR domain-containing protein [Hyphomicrobiales bacterium]|nr:SPOR domain-containing protein [Hyphomicrobiales bacterium]
MPMSDDPANPRGGHPNSRHGHPGDRKPRPERPDYRVPQQPRETAPRGYDPREADPRRPAAEPQRPVFSPRDYPQPAPRADDRRAPEQRSPEPRGYDPRLDPRGGEPRRDARLDDRRPVEPRGYDPRLDARQAEQQPDPRHDAWAPRDLRQSEPAPASRQPAPAAYIDDQFHSPAPARHQAQDAHLYAQDHLYGRDPAADTGRLYGDDPRADASPAYGAHDYEALGYEPRREARAEFEPTPRRDARPETYPAPSNVAPLFLPTGMAEAEPDAARRDHEDYFSADPRMATQRQPEPQRGFDAPQRPDSFALSSANLSDFPEDDFDALDPSPARAPVAISPAPRHADEDALDADFFDDEDYDPAAEAKAKKKGRFGLIAAAFGGALVIAGAGAYYFTLQDAGGEPPTLRAASGDVKEAPGDPGGREFPNQSKKIYDRIETAGGDAPADAGGATGSTGGGGSFDERMEALRQARRPEDAGGARGGNPDEPRLVATEIYGPDGARINPSRPAAPPADSSIVVTTGDVGLGAAPRPVRPFETEPVRPAPAPRPVAAAPAPAPAAPPAVRPAAPVTATAVAAPAGAFFLQISASPDQAKAQAELSTMQNKYGPVLGGYSLTIKSADLGEKGVWYRIRAVGFESKEAAAGMCEKLKAAGMRECLVRAEAQG